MKSTTAAVFGIAIAALSGVVGCSNSEVEAEETAQAETATFSNPAVRGGILFFADTFQGNGRTCGSCHGAITGTINPQEVQFRARFAQYDPLFRHDGADVIGGNTFNRLKTHATIIVNVPMAPNVSVVGSTSRTVAVNRGVPTTMNIGLDPVLMLDGRDPNLQAQARGAILNHAQSNKVTNSELDAIAAFEKTLFNRRPLKQFSDGGPAPTLPEGTTEAQKRGRVFFTDDFVQVQNGTGFRCVHCHSGPMLNQTSPAFAILSPQLGGPPVPPGSRFATVGVSELNTVGDAVRMYEFKLPDGTAVQAPSSDPGRALITGNPADFNAFKISTLWGIKHTAPYFHNNAAKTVTEMVKHYQLFASIALPPIAQLTDGQVGDIVAYLDLL